MGERVIVEGSVQHNPLNEGSILWVTESRTSLGIVDEIARLLDWSALAFSSSLTI
jgi:hypothetical protein